MKKILIKDIGLIALLLASVGMNLAQMSELKKHRALPESESGLPTGSAAIPIVAHDLEDNPVAIAYGGDVPTVVYVFSPRCGWCTRNLSNIAALAEQAPQRYRLIGLSISDEGLREYVREQGWTFPVFSKPSPETTAHFKLRSTPHTIVISPQARVLHSWSGAYVDSMLEEIQTALQIQLPGISK